MQSQNAQERRIARVFWSSPFGGLEEERELLTKKYWPRLAHMCQKAGYEYVPVDMRWGITSGHSTQALTIAICLRELDRSDMIVGFFGQRYGWHGDKDQMLQKTFDYASPSYPFIDEYRDRSVTELEFLHGHLNHPGARAASFFFRDKAYDDQKRVEYEAADDERNARKYRATSDGPNAEQFLDDLKSRVKETKDKCLTIHPNYTTPSEGARLMFETAQDFLQDFLKPQRALSGPETDRLEHHAFLIQKLGMGGKYVGGEGYMMEVDSHVLEKRHEYKKKHLLVTGEPGSGKTCLLGNWILKHQEQYPDDVIAYHIVGCSSSSTSVKNVLQRLSNDVEDALFSVNGGPTPERVYATNGKEDVRELRQILTSVVNKASKGDRRVIIVIDALNMLEKAGKTMKTLYWLPKFLPDVAHLILSSVSSDDVNIRELIQEREFSQLTMIPLTEDIQSTVTKNMLIVRGKELSQQQHDRVVGCSQTENPLFLMILLQELCSFGSFFELDDYIDSLIAVNSVTELFVKFLKRLEKDYNPEEKTNLVHEVMCCLLVARRGLSEGEIKKILGVSDQMWSMLYFAMNDFVVERSGLYVLANTELAEAVRQHFCIDENTQTKFTRLICDYFLQIFKELYPRYNTKIPCRVLEELPWLLCKLGDNAQLQDCLLNLAMFSALYSGQHKYDLVDYWNSTGVPGKEIQQSYMGSLDDQVALLYDQSIVETGTLPRPTPGIQLISVVGDISSFLVEAGHRTVLEPLLLRAIRMHPVQDETKVLTSDLDTTRDYCYRQNQLACFYADTDRFDQALVIHKKLLELKGKLDPKVWASEKAVTLNNMGFLQMKLGNNQQSLEYFQQALAFHKEVITDDDAHEVIASATNNIGSVLAVMGRYDEAAPILERSLEIYEEIYFDSLPPDVGGTLLNLAKCHVRNPEKTTDEVEATYQRALDIRVNAYGHNHPEAAQVLMTYGAYMMRRDKTDEGLKMYLEALDIFEVSYGSDGLDTTMVKENVAMAYVVKGQHEEAIPYFNQAGESLHKLGLMDRSSQFLNSSMLNYYLQNKRMAEAHQVLERVITAQFATEDMFVTLEQLDELLLGDQRPARPFEQTLDYALQKFPSGMRVLGRKLVLLARSGEADAMLDIIRNNPAGRDDPALYMYAYKVFVENGHREEGQRILLAASEHFPDNVVVLENLAKCHSIYKRYPEALEVMERALVVNPQDIDLLILRANLLGMSDQLKESRERLLEAKRIAEKKDDQENVDKITAILKNLDKIIISASANT
ncbi:TPR repeat-containing protein DDB_G0287407-like [Asterias rubens]|uniref:TPR repeat-containing protein DDB_G0287407-like n=1 Tax=Asterias rubens TaxID=7604 RepID=UPI0014554A22|nr:TPR repeat-containing protein DDB_G0287407-like [Asterias rubens]